jgi:hypothetical protein
MRRVVTAFIYGFVLFLLIGLLNDGLDDAVLPAAAFGVFLATIVLVYRQWEKRQQFR